MLHVVEHDFKNLHIKYMVDPIMRLKTKIGVNWAEHVKIHSQLIFSSLRAYEKMSHYIKDPASIGVIAASRQVF